MSSSPRTIARRAAVIEKFDETIAAFDFYIDCVERAELVRLAGQLQALKDARRAFERATAPDYEEPSR